MEGIPADIWKIKVSGDNYVPRFIFSINAGLDEIDSIIEVFMRSVIRPVYRKYQFSNFLVNIE